jgi:hypothetical protein
MKRSDKPLDLQMNLSLLSMPATTVPEDRRRELAQALMELLISAVREEDVEQQNNGGCEDESEAHS